MIRDLAALADREYDIIVVGGGAYGVSVARDAALRGLSVALVEKDDFAHAASGNSFRMVHGGIRYIQHGDIRRLRDSARERSIMLATAPHLVKPLPIAIPTYGHGTQGKAFLYAGMKLYDLFTVDRNAGIRDPDRRIPPCRTLSRRRTMELFPGLSARGLTGAGLFSDGQMAHPMRLAVSILRSAVEAGAQAANYAEVTDFLRDGYSVVGVKVRDRLTDQEFDVRGRMVVNATGGWAERLVERTLGIRREVRQTFSRDLCLVTNRPAPHDVALAVLGGTNDPDAVLSRSKRHLFVVPWRGRTLVGVWHVPYERSPDRIEYGEGEIQQFLDEVNEGYPGFNLRQDEVSLVNAGLVLFGDNEQGAQNLSYGKRSMAVDHRERDGIEGIVTLVGIRWTTARLDAARVVDQLFARDGRKGPRCQTADTPIHGGNFTSVAELVRRIRMEVPDMDPDTVRTLCTLYGTGVRSVLAYSYDDLSLGRPLPHTNVLGAEVVHAVRDEMAVRLEDVVKRRTDLGILEQPPHETLLAAARIMARELDWSAERMQEEIKSVGGRTSAGPAPAQPAVRQGAP